MEVEAKDITVDDETMTATIDASNYKVIHITDENGRVQSVPLPAFGVLEIKCQNYKIGNLGYSITLKR